MKKNAFHDQLSTAFQPRPRLTEVFVDCRVDGIKGGRVREETSDAYVLAIEGFVIGRRGDRVHVALVKERN